MIGKARHSELIANGNDAKRFARLKYIVVEERYAQWAALTPSSLCDDHHIKALFGTELRKKTDRTDQNVIAVTDSISVPP